MEIYSRKKSDCTLVCIWNDPVLYIPKSFDTPISFPNSCLKVNVPLWIEVSDKDCIVIILPKEYNLGNPDDTRELLSIVSRVISSYKPQTER